MRILPKTIFAKGLILICVPLLMEFAFGISMFLLQRYNAEKLAKERTAAEIILHANEMLIDCKAVMFLKTYFNLFGGPEPRVQERIKHIDEEYRLLEKLVVDDPKQKHNVQEIHYYNGDALERIAQLRPVMSQHQGSFGKLATLRSDVDILSGIQWPVDRMAARVKQFRSPEFLSSNAVVPELERTTALVDRIGLGSLAGSALVAMVLFAYFIRSIIQGVKVVVENTERFKQGVELKPRIREGDELAQVDAAFHDMADEINAAQQTKQAIVSMISHDLRSPLTSVYGYLTNLTDGAFGDPSEKTIVDAQKREQDVERLIRLINDVLDLDKIDAGRFELRRKMIYVYVAIVKAISAVTPLVERTGATIQCAESRAQIYADPDRIVQALANILSTVVRLSPHGSNVEICISQNDGQTEIGVTSATASIPGDRLNLLFDRYQQSEQGLRLELPISKEIIHLHSGRIGASSQHPQGLTFWMSLPAAEPDPASGVKS